MEKGTAIHPWEKLGLGRAPYRCIGMTVKKYQACHGAPVQPGGTCEACGQSIMYVFHVLGADGFRFNVGCDCVRKTGWDGEMEREIRKLRRELAREERRAIREAATDEARAAILASNPGLVEALELDHAVVRDIKERFERWGSLSNAQIALVLRLAAEAKRAPEVHVPAPTGRTVVEGTVLSTRVDEGPYGNTIKMCVKVATEGGVWLCWGTVPREILHQNANRRGETVKGARVQFTATLQPGREPHFAFFSRPTKASVLAWP